MTKLEQWDHGLMEAILEERPVQEQLDIAASALSNPVALFDTSFSLICYSGDVPKDFEDPIWETVLSSGYSSVQNFPTEFLRFYEKNRDVKGPLLFPDFSVPSDNRILSCRLENEEGPFAILAMDELVRPLTEEDIWVLSAIQNRLQHSRAIQDTAGSVEGGSSSVLNRVLTGNSVPETQFQKMVSERHWKTTWNYQTVVIPVSGQPADLGEATFASMIRRFKFADPSFQYFLTDGNIVGVRTANDPLGCDPTLSLSAIRILDSLDLYAGLSMWFRGYGHLKDGYDQALAVAKLGRAAGNPGDRVCDYRALSRTDLLQHLEADGRSIESFCHPAVLPLVSGQTANEDLFRTLCAYLDSGHHAARAATVLGIHRNTVLYRLRSIEELTGLPLEHPDQLSPSELQHLKLSCILLFTGLSSP